jgi:hypothetical protein
LRYAVFHFFRNEVFVDAIKSCGLMPSDGPARTPQHATFRQQSLAAPAALIRLYELLKNDSRSNAIEPVSARAWRMP